MRRSFFKYLVYSTVKLVLETKTKNSFLFYVSGEDAKVYLINNSELNFPRVSVSNNILPLLNYLNV